MAHHGRQRAQKNALKPHLTQTWCLGNLDAAFLAHLERVLALYALRYPVICFDERPCFLIGDTLTPVPRQSGKVRKEHYTYEKLGSWVLLAAIEPQTGQRLEQVHAQRTKREYTVVLPGARHVVSAGAQRHIIKTVDGQLTE